MTPSCSGSEILLKASLFDVPVSPRTLEQGIAAIENIIKDKVPGLVVLANANTFNLAYEINIYKAVLRKAHIVLRDGVGVEWALRRKGIPALHNFVGTDFIPDFCKATAHKGYRIYLLGSKPTICQEAAKKLQALAPGIIISGCHHGYFPENRSDEIANQINRSKADILLVAMGNPRQELWISEYLHKLTVPACIGVGALFDYLSGAVRRAPQWMLRAKMEWVFRLVTEPRRLGKRYVIGNTKFLLRVCRETRKGQFVEDVSAAFGSSRKKTG